MKCLLVASRWNDLNGLLPSSGRPYLDLLLMTLGYSEMVVEELYPDAPFDPTAVSEEYGLILIQSEPGPSRVRRSLLSSMGLSLGLDGDDSDRLRVTGAKPLHDADGQPVGFAVKRRGRFVVFFEKSIWDLRYELVKTVTAIQSEEAVGNPPRRGRGVVSCWMVEPSFYGGDPNHLLEGAEGSHCEVLRLPNGDLALLVSSTLGEELTFGIQGRLGSALYAIEPLPLEEVVGNLCIASGVRLAAAESCTGGLFFSRLTSVPGSSAYLNASLVTYSNDSKQKVLNVSSTLIERFGAVSPEVALSMARGALHEGNSDIAVSITGIAGPSGGTPDKPVGTVFLAAIDRYGNVLEHRGLYQGTRDSIRLQSSQSALHLLRRLLLSRR